MVGGLAFWVWVWVIDRLDFMLVMCRESLVFFFFRGGWFVMVFCDFGFLTREGGEDKRGNWLFLDGCSIVWFFREVRRRRFDFV